MLNADLVGGLSDFRKTRRFRDDQPIEGDRVLAQQHVEETPSETLENRAHVSLRLAHFEQGREHLSDLFFDHRGEQVPL